VLNDVKSLIEQPRSAGGRKEPNLLTNMVLMMGRRDIRLDVEEERNIEGVKGNFELREEKSIDAGERRILILSILEIKEIRKSI